MKIHIKRKASLIHKIIAKIINEIIQDDKIGFINITDVELSNDLSFSNIYYTILDNKEENLFLVEKIIEKNKKKIRIKLASEIKNIKKIPNLIFKYDNTDIKGGNIDKILDNIKKKNIK
jgi:ribosome-binding factor A